MGTMHTVVVGGGHNGLVAAILAATAGHQVTLLEAADRLGGATAGERLFPGVPTRLSRYSYLVSLFPDELADRLGIPLTLLTRAVASYTPTGGGPGLLIEQRPGPATAESFRRLTGSAAEFAAWQRFSGELGRLASAIEPVLRGPLVTERQARDRAEQAGAGAIFDELTGCSLGDILCRRFTDDTVRGVLATDGLIGTHASLFDESLLANRCLLYHVLGRGTGEWLVPVGGMGALVDALVDRARSVGVTCRTGAEVVGLEEADDVVEVMLADGTAVPAEQVLAAVAPAVVRGWLGQATPPPTGAQLKVNLKLDRLPRLRSGVDPAVAFAGTLHLDEGLENLEAAYAASAAGVLPDPLPAEVYCHSLTDPSILGGAGGHTLTLFALHTPPAVFADDPDGSRAAERALAGLQRHLAEPLADCLSHDERGRPCVQVTTPMDLQRELRMPGGHIFHGDLSWPWQEPSVEADDSTGGEPVFGVEIDGSTRVLLAGAGTRRGGGVSGLGGAAAVDALLARHTLESAGRRSDVAGGC